MALNFSGTKSYVYKLVHKDNNKFYFGSRCANKVEAEEDLLIYYFTSSKNIIPIWYEFEGKILKKFENWKDAVDYENRLIKEHWGNPNLLNKSLFTDNKVCYAPFKSDQHKKNIGLSNSKPKNYFKGKDNPKAKEWVYVNLQTGEFIIIDDLVNYCINNNINYKTMQNRKIFPIINMNESNKNRYKFKKPKRHFWLTELELNNDA